nr:hypothetical protein [Tanacetum cinerariifolium]
MPLLGELGVVADEPMVGPIVDEIVELIVKAEEQVIAHMVDMDEDIAMLFGNDDFEDDDSEGFDEEEVWEVNEEWVMAPVTPPLMLVVSSLSIYKVNDAEVVAVISIGQIGPRVFAVEGQVQVMASQMFMPQTDLSRLLQPMVSEMSNRESTLMRCIIGMDIRFIDLERRPPGPQ